MNKEITTNSIIKMTSLEIAKLTGKPHKTVLTDLRSIKDKYPNIKEIRKSIYKNSQGKCELFFLLSHQAVILLMCKYSDLELIAKVLGSKNISDLVQTLQDLDTHDLPEDTYVYVATEFASGRHKIGISKDPESRVKELNIGNPQQFVLVHSYLATESVYQYKKLAHKISENEHIRSEWFNTQIDLEKLPSFNI